MKCLIVALPHDTQISSVTAGLELLGHECDVLYPLDLCDRASWTWSPAEGLLTTSHSAISQQYPISEYCSVWVRRPPTIIPQAGIDDIVEKSIAEAEFSSLVKSVYAALDASAFCVNSFDASLRASNKAYQFSEAVSAGLPLPRTLVSNSRKEVLSFFSECSEQMIYKPLKPGVWAVDTNGSVRSPEVPTTVMTRELLRGADLSASPGIYQPNIDKQAEVRATVMGRSIFAWCKSFERNDLDVDWRFMHAGAKISRYYVHDELAGCIFDLMDRLGLVFGCVDLVIDRSGEIHFLEINPQGQFLWADQYGIGLNQFEGFCEFLISCDSKFRYSQSDQLRLNDLPPEKISSFHEEEALNRYGRLGKNCYHQISSSAFPDGNSRPASLNYGAG